LETVILNKLSQNNISIFHFT